jgi:F0F1-type ATP synthase membrane subunit b/b'
MGESQLTSTAGISELSRTIGEYRAIVDELMQKEKEKIRQMYDREANSIISGAWQKAEEIIANSQKEGLANREKIESQARKEAAEILAAAKSKAQQVISEAEFRDKKEAKARTKTEVDRIIAEARVEGNNIILAAKKQAEMEAGEIINKVQQEAQRLIREEMDKLRAEAQAQLAKDVLEAQKKAKAMIDEFITGSNSVSELILKIMQQGDAIVGRFKNELQGQLGELSKAIAIAKSKTTPIAFEAVEAKIAVTPPVEIVNRKAILNVRLKGERPPGNHVFKGHMELKTVSPDDYKHIARMREFLVQIPNIKFTGEDSSEEETSFSFEIKESLPVVDILSNMPSV